MHHDIDCAFCKDNIPLRQRFVAEVIFDGKLLHWEYGVDVQKQLQTLVSFIDATGHISLLITRLGKNRDTFYRCTHIEGHNSIMPSSKYISGKYGHMVRR